MGFRFRRRLRIFPGLYLNVSKSGATTSIGGRGATLNLSKRGTRTTVGLPGSGLSWRSPTKHWEDSAQIHATANTGLELHHPNGRVGRWILRGLVFVVLIVAATVVILAFK
jgi:hypothetical protein